MAIIHLDPGGDAVQVVGYFNVDPGSTGLITFDTSKKVVGLGSWKHNSGSEGAVVASRVLGVLGAARRTNISILYDTVPDTIATDTLFADSPIEAYSGGGFTDPANVGGDNGIYATATPAQNSGQGTVYGTFGFNLVVGTVIDSIKIIYERKYDTTTSIGISRVKVRVNGVEGPDHDNTDEPTVDTVVEVDVTLDRSWEIGDLVDGVFGVITEARRGDTATAHTQSWDYVKVEITYHTAVTIWAAESGGTPGFGLALLPKGSGVVVRLLDGLGNPFDGSIVLLPNEFNRVTLSYVLNATDDLDVKTYVNSIPELDLETLSTAGASPFPDMRYGWITSPGDDFNIWFDQILVDDVNDLSDPGNILMTAKLPVTVNNDNFDTTGGTGAVNERPVDLVNYRAQIATAQNLQDYTIQAANVGDVDLTGKTLVGHMGWLIAKKTGLSGSFGFILDGNITGIGLTTTPALVRLGVVSASYPSNAAGVGLRSATGSNDAYLYECGIIQAYEGPADDPLFPLQSLAEDSLTQITDDLRSDMPVAYELRLDVNEGGGDVLVTARSIVNEDAAPQLCESMGSNGGRGVAQIKDPGIELDISIQVTGAAATVGLRRTLNPV